jgi:ADP-heptose:LPS heptosyltransferase
MSNFRSILKIAKLSSLKTIVKIADALSLTKKNSSLSPQNCLIISTTGLGDTIFGTPAIRELKRKYPRMILSALTKAGGREILYNNPNVNLIYVFKKGIFNFFSLLADIRKSRFDTVIIFHCTDRILWLLAYLTGASKIIGSDRERHNKGMDFLLTNPVSMLSATHPIYERFLLVNELNVKADSIKMDFFISDRDKGAFLDGVGSQKFLIGFQPGSARLYQRWPKKYFVSLGRLLKEKFKDIEIVVTGSDKERILVESIAKEINGISLAGLSIGKTAELMKRCSLFVSNDTGPMHISVAIGTPTIALCSATGGSCGPYKQLETFASIEKEKPCDECEGKSCNNPVCMEQISPEEVFEKATEMLSVTA